MKTRVLTTTLAFVTLSLPAMAEPATPRDTVNVTAPHAAATTDLVARVGVGAGKNASMDGVLASSLDLTLRHQFFQGGIELTGDSEIMGGNYGSAGGLAGVGVQDSSGVRFELLAATGVGKWSGIGCGLFCDAGGASASLPYVGGRASVAYAFARRARGHFVLGLSGYHDRYLGSETVTYTTTSDNWFSEGSSTTTSEMRFSGSRGGGLLTLGGIVDL
jgi:hypothetical protein